jgi:anti-sigma B factor antagonist
MDVLVERDGDVLVATPIAKHLDLSNSDAFRHEVIMALVNCRKLVLDMERVEFVDSRGCGAGAGGDLKLCSVKPAVRTVLELIRLHRICEILDTRDQAIFSFESLP